MIFTQFHTCTTFIVLADNSKKKRVSPFEMVSKLKGKVLLKTARVIMTRNLKAGCAWCEMEAGSLPVVC